MCIVLSKIVVSLTINTAKQFGWIDPNRESRALYCTVCIRYECETHLTCPPGQAPVTSRHSCESYELALILRLEGGWCKMVNTYRYLRTVIFGIPLALLCWALHQREKPTLMVRLCPFIYPSVYLCFSSPAYLSTYVEIWQKKIISRHSKVCKLINFEIAN